MIKLVFLSGNNTNRIIELYFDEKNKNEIKNIKTFNDKICKVIFKVKNVKDINSDFLLKWFKDYMGGNFTLDHYIDHINNYGFYSPYFNSLNINVEEVNN